MEKKGDTSRTGIVLISFETREVLGFVIKSLVCHRFMFVVLKAHSQVGDNFWQLKSSLKMMEDEKYFFFHFESSFHSHNILIFVLTFSSCKKTT